MRARTIALIIATLITGTLGAQNRWALKSNLLHDATASVNLSLEYSPFAHWSAELSGSVNMWDLPRGLKLKHAIVQPELKYWLCDRFNGWFFDVHAFGGYIPIIGGLPLDFSKYYHKFPNLSSFNMRNGILVGGGVGFGYDVILGRHWNLELEMGVGYMFLRGNEYSDDVLILKNSKFDYIGPTKLGVTICYLF